MQDFWVEKEYINSIIDFLNANKLIIKYQYVSSHKDISTT